MITSSITNLGATTQISTMAVARISTQHYPKLIDPDQATEIYKYLRDNIAWVDGIRSRRGPTRKACPMALGQDDILDAVILETFHLLKMKEVKLVGIYLNYYRKGSDFTPNHSHPGMKQVVISLGATRVLTVGTKSYPMGNGDVIIFGSSVHGIPEDPTCQEGRISIALFIEK